MFGLDIALLVGGAVITESVFNLDGLGFMAVDSVFRQDLPATLGVVLVGNVRGRDHESRGRHRLRLPRPARALRMSGELLLDVRDLAVAVPDARTASSSPSPASPSRCDAVRRSASWASPARARASPTSPSSACSTAERSKITGEILLHGKDLLKASPAELRDVRGKDVAMIFQDPFACLHPMYRVGDQIAEAVRAHATSRRAGRSSVRSRCSTRSASRMPARARSDYPHQFSGGMRQRAMIAMALVHNPDVLIADEPTTALDVTVQAQILELIDKVKRDFDIGVILITHDLGVVAETAQTVMVMYAGRAVEHGPAREVFDAPQHPYTWGLLESMPTRRGQGRATARDRGLAAVGHPPAARLPVPPALPAPLRALRRRSGRRSSPWRAATRTPATSTPSAKRRLWAEREAARLGIGGMSDSSGATPLDRGRGPDEALPGDPRACSPRRVGRGACRRGRHARACAAARRSGIVGESGCGKSTTARLMLKLLEPTAGTIRFDGRDITRLSPRDMRPLRREMQMVFQDPYSSLNPRQTVGQIIGQPFSIHKTEGDTQARWCAS